MLDDRQKRAFVALACKVAWADGVVAPEERAQVAMLLERLGGTTVTPSELDTWLTSGAPPAELSELPEAMAEMFIYEAMKLIESDGDMAASELALMDELLGRVRQRHDETTTLARIALAKKPARETR